MFLQSFLRSPLQVGSFIPSSSFMINKIVDCVRESHPVNIVEMGAGTGVITKGLRQLESSSLFVFEKDAQMRELLLTDFPDLNLYHNAFDLQTVMDENHIEDLDCIVCGLPLTLFPKKKKQEILHLFHSKLRPGGHFVMFQYSLHSKKDLERMYADVSVHFIPFNLPPAFIYHCQK